MIVTVGVAYAVAMDAADTLSFGGDPAYQDADLQNVSSTSDGGSAPDWDQRVIIMVADDNARGREFWRRCGWEEITGAITMGIDL
jgi:hypothetical protein